MQFYSCEMPCHTIRSTGRKPSRLTFVVTAVALWVESGVQCGVDPLDLWCNAIFHWGDFIAWGMSWVLPLQGPSVPVLPMSV